MRKTTFAGLTQLDPGESLLSDGGSFTAVDPDITDHFLQIGARTHRHTGTPALPAPQTAPVLNAAPGDGTLPADTTLLACYTLVDAAGGETLPSPAAMITTPAGLDAPDQPTTEILYDAGTLTVGTYSYAVTLVDVAGGETLPGPLATVQRDPVGDTARIEITDLARFVVAGVSRYRLYRAKGNEQLRLLWEGTDDVINDDGSLECDCCTNPPEENSTQQTNGAQVTVPSEAIAAEAAGWRLYLSLEGEFVSPALFGPTRLPGEAGARIDIHDLALDVGAPPDVATAVAAAAQLDPDTELLDWHWKRPVATAAELPMTPQDANGDVRMVLADGTMYVRVGGTWQVFTAPPRNWMSPVANVAALPGSGNQEGDVRLARATLTLHAWRSGAWAAIAGGGGPVTPPLTIADEVTALPQRNKLAFKGLGVHADDDAAGGQTVVTIAGGGGGAGGAMQLGDRLAWELDGQEAGALVVDRAEASEQLYSFDGPTSPDASPAPTWYPNSTLQVLNGGLTDAPSGQPGTDYYTAYQGTSVAREFEVQHVFTLDTDQWTMLGTASLGGDLTDPSSVYGVELVLTEGQQLILQYRAAPAPAPWDTAQIWSLDTLPPVGAEVVLRLKRLGDTFSVLALDATNQVLYVETVVAVPPALADFDGWPAMHVRYAAHNAWRMTNSSAARPSYVYQLVATLFDGVSSQERTLLDTSGRNQWGSGAGRGTFSPDWKSIGFEYRELDDEVQMRGKVAKFQSGPPFADELIYTFADDITPYGKTFAVVSGDNNGVEHGIATINDNYELRWTAGRASDPAERPFLGFDGVRL
jgi:hypothetical protein